MSFEDERRSEPRSALSPALRNGWTTFAIIAIGVLMATIDSSIVNVALPVIARYFGAALGGAVEWVIIAYLVVVAALLLTAGRLADVVGRRRAWVWGLVLFTLGSALCGASPSLPALVGFRAVQGIGGALIMAVSPAMIVGAFPPERRGRVLGYNAVVVGLGISLGPTLGGMIAEHFGWRWIFYVNVPLGALGVLASLAMLRSERTAVGGRLDVAGAVLLAVGIGAMTGTISFGGELRSPFLPPFAGSVAAVLALVGFWYRQLKRPDPIVDPKLFRNRVFVSASASLLLGSVATFAVAFVLPFYFEQLRGWPVERTGILLTPLPLTVALLSPLTGALADRVGTRQLAAGGMLIAAGGLLWLALADVETPVLRIVMALVIVGGGRAIFQPPNNSALMGSAPRDRQGVAAGLMATSRVLGQSLSVALAGVLFTTFGGSGAARALRGGQHVATPFVADAFLRGMRAALLGCALMALAASLVALVRGREAR
ncbi:MAG TPA: MFS transporter [Polyangiaceae bacterium]|nr:MFS transporter [Polyangiaceae bacterium]